MAPPALPEREVPALPEHEPAERRMPFMDHLTELRTRQQLDVQVVPMDVTSDAEVEQAVRMIERQAGRVDVLVNNAGCMSGGITEAFSVKEFEQQFRLNVRGTYLMIQAAVAKMLQNDPPDRGSIVCVGTRAALQPFKGAAGYIASKAAVIALAQAVAVEYKDDLIRCNVILPSVIDTPANRASMPKADHEKWVKPEQIAGEITHLLSPDSEPVNGAAIPVYGRA